MSSLLIFLWMWHLDPVKASFSLAEAIATVSITDSRPLDAASLLTSIAFHESHFDLDAESPPSDSTVSTGPFQLATAWTHGDARKSLSLVDQARISLFLIRDSQFRCGGRLTMYTSGNCHSGQKEARDREALAHVLETTIFLEPAFPAQKKRRSVYATL